jgi:hypothetical protein
MNESCPPQNDALPGDTDFGKAQVRLSCLVKNVLPASRICFECGEHVSPKRAHYSDIAGGIEIRIPPSCCPSCGSPLLVSKTRKLEIGQVTLCSQ